MSQIKQKFWSVLSDLKAEFEQQVALSAGKTMHNVYCQFAHFIAGLDSHRIWNKNADTI